MTSDTGRMSGWFCHIIFTDLRQDFFFFLPYSTQVSFAKFLPKIP